MTSFPSMSGRDEADTGWGDLAVRVRPYLAAGAWQSAHDLLWAALESDWEADPLPVEATECLCLLLNACVRLNHADHLRTGTLLLQRLLEHGPALDRDTRGLCALVLAQQEIRQGRYDDAGRRLSSAQHEPEGLRADTRARLALLNGRLAALQGREGDAEKEGLAAVRWAELAGSDILKADAFALLAIQARRRGALAEANTLYARSARDYWSAGDLHGHAVILLNRAWTVGLIGLLPHALRLFEEALHHALALGRETTALLARLGLGWLAVRRGDTAAARALLLSAWRRARRMGLPREEGLALEYLAELHLLGGRAHKARIALRRGAAIAARLAPDNDLALELRIREAGLALLEGRNDAARLFAQEAIERAVRMGAVWEEAQSWSVFAVARYRGGQAEQAREAFRQAHSRLLRMGEQIERRLVEAWLDVLREEGHGSPADDPSGDGHPVQAAARVRGGSGNRPLRGNVRTDEGEETWLDFWLHNPVTGVPAVRSDHEDARFDDEAPTPKTADMKAERGRHRIPSASPSPGDARSALHPVWRAVGLVTHSPELLRALHMVETYAPSRIPVLILGATGTGKDLLAQGLHALSGRTGPMVPINCAAARKDLFVAELFGARRGAYTGATDHHRGLIEEAEQGTIFLDEIADLEAEAQGFLLRFLDSGEIRRLGETRSRRVETRVVAATCADLEARVAAGLFRPDLFGRLAGLVVRVPSLRERPEDIEVIAAALWQSEGGASEEWGRIFTAPVLAALRGWHWPGNARELKHAVARALLYARAHGPAAAAAGLLDYARIMASAPSPRLSPPEGPAAEGPRWTWGRWDRQRLEQALAEADGRIPAAARILGLSRSHAYRLYRRLGDSAPDDAGATDRERRA
ncbi:MAG: sigma 54-interacting transcriptional regulator [Candidatus Eisenbacteria bacterium]